MKSHSKKTAISKKILVIEDNDAKFRALEAVLGDNQILGSPTRAKTVTEGEDCLERLSWDLIILDISMDIRGSSRGAMGGGHANLGGLDIAEGMYLARRTFPTIILTGFDYFQMPTEGSRRTLVGLSEIEVRAKKFLKNHFIACVRYGASDWQRELTLALTKWNAL